jgi:hypothetical protein
VQRRNQGAIFCVFGLDGRCLHVEPTSLSYGALFGPDVSDVAGWQDRAQQVVDGWQASRQGRCEREHLLTAVPKDVNKNSEKQINGDNARRRVVAAAVREIRRREGLLPNLQQLDENVIIAALNTFESAGGAADWLPVDFELEGTLPAPILARQPLIAVRQSRDEGSLLGISGISAVKKALVLTK